MCRFSAVVANSEMYRDATNLFRVRFTLTRDYDFSKAFGLFDNWYKTVDEQLHTDRIEETYHELEVSVRLTNLKKKEILKNVFLGIATSPWFWCN